MFYIVRTMLIVFGNGVTANRKILYEKTNDKGNKISTFKWEKCDCSDECEFRLNKQCQKSAWLDFIIKDIEVDGVWRIRTKSVESIYNLEKYFNFQKSMNRSIANKNMRLSVRPSPRSLPGGNTIAYVISVRQCTEEDEANSNTQVINNQTNKKNNDTLNIDNSTNYYILDTLEKVVIDEKNLLNCVLVNSKDQYIKALLDATTKSGKELAECKNGTVIYVNKVTSNIINNENYLCILDYEIKNKQKAA